MHESNAFVSPIRSNLKDHDTHTGGLGMPTRTTEASPTNIRQVSVHALFGACETAPCSPYSTDYNPDILSGTA